MGLYNTCNNIGIALLCVYLLLIVVLHYAPWNNWVKGIIIAIIGGIVVFSLLGIREHHEQSVTEEDCPTKLAESNKLLETCEENLKNQLLSFNIERSALTNCQNELSKCKGKSAGCALDLDIMGEHMRLIQDQMDKSKEKLEKLEKVLKSRHMIE